MLPDHELHYTLPINLPRERVFAFFSDAGNLQLITPPELNFAIITPLPIEMRVGALIDYRLELFGVPFSWRTEICEWNPPYHFVDRQLRGPYAKWVHRHSFTTTPDGTLVTDDVHFRLPLLPVGEAAYPMVKLQLERIFSYRQEKVRELLT
jgi:ligand-binding SRPBCC domain-containing protein